MTKSKTKKSLEIAGLKTSFAEVNETSSVVETVLKVVRQKLDEGLTLAIGLDVDKTLVYHTAHNGMIEAAPDAFYPNSLRASLDGIKEYNEDAVCFAVTGRSVEFTREHFGLEGSGQFHAEMSDIFTGEHKMLKPKIDLTVLHAPMTEIAKGCNGFLEDDKSHHLCIVSDMLSEKVIHAAGGLVDVYNSGKSKPEEKLVLEHGDDFVEVGPKQTCKGEAVEQLLGSSEFFDNSFFIYCGDTPDKDFQPMKVAFDRGGLGIGVGPRFSGRDDVLHVNSPADVHDLIEGIRVALVDTKGPKI